MSENYKAFLVYSSLVTRIIMPANSTEEEIYAEAKNQFIEDLGYINLINFESYEEDIEVPYDKIEIL